MNLSQTASTISVSASLPRSTICGGGDAETMVSSLGQAIVSSSRSSTTTLAGMTLRMKQLEWLTVVIIAPHCGQTRSSGGTRLNTDTRGKCAGGALRPGWRPRRFFFSSSEDVSSLVLAWVTMRPSSGSTSCRSRRSSDSERGRARRRCASCATSSVLRSRMRAMSATIAVTISTNFSVAIIFCSHARISSRSGANAEVTLSREPIRGLQRMADGLIPRSDDFLRSQRGGLPSRSTTRPREVDAFDDQRQLGGLDRDRRQAAARSEGGPKTALLESFGPHRKSGPVPIHDAHAVTSFGKENEQVTAQWIVAEHVPHESHKAVRALSTIDRLRRDE